MQRLPVARHRRAGQARATYRACSHPVAKTRWHAIGLRLRGDRPRCPAFHRAGPVEPPDPLRHSDFEGTDRSA